ncbi:alkyl sulfatase dimerization domain-containing protein [Okeania sp. SIO2B3]|uniref:alkyl sulfatase dimerization domain-containing protein n=1 Tax=Okeania sp. SIO2B3 TaxID=2607784 RepID=UPI0013C05142|nr:alkyl sulfatase dimerization domain-containing protein [Okeania sp. SIO2B3]NET42858.1 MBL fold metallo-hydrolase [Okeania sp. SIO2B3]
MFLNGLWNRILRGVVAFTLVTALLLTTPTKVLAATYEPNYPDRYMGGPANLATAQNGAIVYDKTLEATENNIYTEPYVDELKDEFGNGIGIWVIGGESMVNCIVIEAPLGLIVYETGSSGEDGERFREVIESQISTKPIKAIIYSHSHYAFGAGAMVDDPDSVEVIGHPKLKETVENMVGEAPSAIPELSPILTARKAVQFNNYLPAEGQDAAIAAKLEYKEKAYLPVTYEVEDSEKRDVAGLTLEFFTKYISDDYSVTVWIPEKKAVLNNFFWPGTPNLYSLRGALYRDPQQLIGGLKVIQGLEPTYLISNHARAISGKTQAAEALSNYVDLIALTYDQTLRGILQGLGPDELRYFIYKPQHLADSDYNAEIYGETPWYPPAVFYYQMGWYDRNPTKIFQLPPQETAQRLVALMGGRDAVVAAAQLALDDNEYAWAAQLIDYIYELDPKDAEARTIRANALRKMGQLSMGSIGRAWLLSEARALEGKERIQKLIPPDLDTIAEDPTTYVNYHRVRIDPRKAEPIDKVITFTFSDLDNKTVGLHIRRGVAEFIREPANYNRPSDIEVSLTSETWAKLYLNRTTLPLAIILGNAEVLTGTDDDAVEILNLFDKFNPVGNLFTVPPVGPIPD